MNDDRSETDQGMTVGELRAVIAKLPDQAAILCEAVDGYYARYDVNRALTIGAATDDPALILKLQER